MCLSIGHRDCGFNKKAGRGQLAAPRQSSGQAGRKELGLLLGAWCRVSLASPLPFEESLLTMPDQKGAEPMIDLPEGLYEVDQAYLVDGSKNRLALRNVTFEVWLDKKGRKQLRGRGLINNFLFATMLEDCEEVDLVLRFFDDYFLWLKEPVIQAGKVFEPATESSCIFSLGESVTPMSQEQFLELTGLNQLDTKN
jgi:hypothetical protein